mmetsp:Transcript_40425/g.43872  ORF Transcript_40425/g.43872 Transcript_40425/m.43872 type:complete len:804 (-) Transcript_40425:190-2601(-)
MMTQNSTTKTTTPPVVVPTKGVLKKASPLNGSTTVQRRNKKDKEIKTRQSVFTNASYGSHGHDKILKKNVNVQSLTYVCDESDVWRAHSTIEHHMLRGEVWNSRKFKTIQEYFWIVMTGVMQACIAYATNMSSKIFIESKFEMVSRYLEHGAIITAFLRFYLLQLAFAMIAGVCVWIEPISGGSGIPEVKCYLNGIDLPNVLDIRTLFCKVIGVTASVSAGLPVGKEGPMIHSGAVVAKTVASGRVKNDRQLRDLVTCGAAAGVCTAFSAPIGGILFALEEGASYWSPSLTWRTFTCSMVAMTTLQCLNSVGTTFGRVGFNKLFSFGNFVFKTGGSNYSLYELIIFVAIGAVGGLIGAIFNNINETITHWRMKNVNVSRKYRFIEVCAISTIMSFVMFFTSLAWPHCKAMDSVFDTGTTEVETNVELRDELIQFRCKEGEYNEMASLIFSEPGDAIKLLFHLDKHAFSPLCLVTFFFLYITVAVMTYGIAVPSGLFVPSLLSGAAFGRLFGNMIEKLLPGQVAFSNTYALIGAAAVLGGMARMTISLTVILLECTGNMQFVLPLMLVLMTARIVGSVYNDDLYHIHIHLKKGVEFLDAELNSITSHHGLVAGQIMGCDVIYTRPIEEVGVVYDILMSAKHSNFPVVDTDDKDVLYGTIGRNQICVLLQHRAFGHPIGDSHFGASRPNSVRSNFLQVGEKKYFPLVQWEALFKSYPRYPDATDLRITEEDRKCLLDLRPYINSAAISIQETSSVERTYSMFRSLGLRFLPVVNKYNQVVGTITRSDLTADSLAETMMQRGEKHE